MSVSNEEKECRYSKTIRHRIARNVGHLDTVKKMMDESADFSDIMMQLAAVRASLTSTANKLMAEQMNQALQEAEETGDSAFLKEVYHTVDKYFGR